MVPINYWAVLVGAVVAMILGFIWYGPLFGKKWAKLSGLSMDKMKPNPVHMGIMALGALLMSFVLSHAIIFASAYLKETGVSAGLMGALWNWLGFVAPVTIGVVLWEGKSWHLWFINAGYYLVSLILMSLVLTLWV